MLLTKIIAAFPLLHYYSAIAHPLKISKHLAKRGEFSDFNAFSLHPRPVQLGGVDSMCFFFIGWKRLLLLNFDNQDSRILDPKLELENHGIKIIDLDCV
jgi:hypothetical protein